MTKRYGGHTAVSDLSFTVDSGQIYGFLGPNGAGKSTTMNIMTGCLSATEGAVRIDGHDIFEEPEQAKRLIGYLPEQPPLYMNETPEEYLRFVGEAKGLRGTELERQIDEVIRQTGIEGVARRRISALSKGYKQRVGIAQALLGNPKVIILDEPTVGLDPIQIIEIRDLIKELGQTHTVIFSSHILSEVQTIIYQISSDQYQNLMAASYDDLRHLEVFAADFTDVRQIDISLEGDSYTLTSEEKGKERTWSCQGEELEIDDLKETLEALRADEFTSEKPSQKEEIGLTVHLDNEHFPTVSIRLYRYDGTHCLAVVDGESVALVNRGEVVDLIEAIHEIVLN